MKYDLIVIGCGPAGMATAVSAYENGVKNILILERDAEAGGILNQCIHNGFGLHYFKAQLTGPEYAQKFINLLRQTPAQLKLETMVLQIEDTGNEKAVHFVNSTDGYVIAYAKAVVLAMGCRERSRGAIQIPGSRPSGIFSAGAAQRYINVEGYMVGKRAVILGSGDIGLIMARRLTLEGAKVLAVVEIMPYSGGLNRNIVQCLEDYNIPLYLSHTVTDIIGESRLEKVVVSKVDENRRPIPGTEMEFDCDTLLLSVGLIPENELSKTAGVEIDPRTGGAIVYEDMQTSVPGIFACGNVLHVHDLVDFVTVESQQAGAMAARYILEENTAYESILKIENGEGVSYTVPQKLRPHNIEKGVNIYLRVKNIYENACIAVYCGNKQIARYKREHMAPGEMEKIVLPKKLLAQCEEKLVIKVEAKV